MRLTSRKRSPAAPTISLEDALNRTLRVYDKERRHEVPLDVAAADMGYKNAKSGSALQTIASIRYYGLMQRPKDGMLNVSVEVENYKFTPDSELKQRLLIQWLRAPKIFSELLDKFPENLPSNPAIRYELIQLGFTPDTADDVVSKFKQSVEFVRYYEQSIPNQDKEKEDNYDVPNEISAPLRNETSSTIPDKFLASDVDRIPIRLAGGRKAFVEIPTPFFEADKARIIAQINLLLTEEDENVIADL